jgi:hypothetical protein
MVDVIFRGSMNVIDSAGVRIGSADQVEGQRMRLTNDDGLHYHFLPLDSVAWIGRFVHLKLSREEAMRQWTWN